MDAASGISVVVVQRCGFSRPSSFIASASGLWLLQASTICSFATLGVNAVKMLLDFVQLCRSVARRLGINCNDSVATAAEELLCFNDANRQTCVPKCTTNDEEAEVMYPVTPGDLGELWTELFLSNADDFGDRSNVSCECVTIEKRVELFAAPPATPNLERSFEQLMDDFGLLWIDHETALAGTSDIMAIGRSVDFESQEQTFLL